MHGHWVPWNGKPPHQGLTPTVLRKNHSDTSIILPLSHYTQQVGFWCGGKIVTEVRDTLQQSQTALHVVNTVLRSGQKILSHLRIG